MPRLNESAWSKIHTTYCSTISPKLIFVCAIAATTQWLNHCPFFYWSYFVLVVVGGARADGVVRSSSARRLVLLDRQRPGSSLQVQEQSEQTQLL